MSAGGMTLKYTPVRQLIDADIRRAAIYTTKIDEFVCPPNISETVAVRTMKLAHRSYFVSTTIKLISKSILLSFLSILLKQFSQSALARLFGRLRSFPFAAYIHTWTRAGTGPL